jgi:hypothetical protein
MFEPRTRCRYKRGGAPSLTYLHRRPRGPSLSPPEASRALAISPGGLAGARYLRGGLVAPRSLRGGLAGPRYLPRRPRRPSLSPTRPRGPSLSPRRPRGPSLSPWWPRGPGVSGLHIWFFRLCGAIQKPKLWKCLVFYLGVTRFKNLKV